MKPKQWLIFAIVIIGARFLYESFGDDFVAAIGGLLVITFFWYTHEIASNHKSAGDSYWLWFFFTFTFAGLLVPIYLFKKLTKPKGF